MKYSKVVSLILLALISVIMDSSFFSTLSVFGATIISSYSLAINFALIEKYEFLLLFCSFLAIFFSIFSSMSIWLILLLFILVPAALYIIKGNYFPDLTPLYSVAIFIAATVIFATVTLFEQWQISSDALVAVIYFMIINTIFGVFINALIHNFRKKFMREIKF